MARVAERLAVTAWSARSDVPWFDAHIPLLTEACGVDPAMMDKSFAGLEQLRGWFVEAGLRAEIAVLETTATLPDEFTTSYLSALPWGQSFSELDPVVREAALAAVSERLARYRLASGDLEIPFKAFIVTAQPD